MKSSFKICRSRLEWNKAKNQQNKSCFAQLTLLNGLVTSAFLFFSQSVLAEKVFEKTVAIVNDQMITLSDLEQFKQKLSKDSFVDELLFTLNPKEKVLSDRATMISHLINEKIVESEIKKLGLSATIERVEQEIRSVSEKNRMTRNQLKEALAQKGIEFSEYQDFMKRGIERQMLVEKVISSRIKITDEELAAHFASLSNNSKLAQVFEYTISHILFQPKNSSDRDAKEKAEKVLAKIKEGIPFEKLVSQYTEEINFSSGGSLGTFKAGEMSGEIEKAVSPLKSGEVSGVVRTRLGYHIFKLNKKTLIDNPALAEQRAKLRNELFQVSFNKQLKTWIEQKRSEAFIRINE